MKQSKESDNIAKQMENQNKYLSQVNNELTKRCNSLKIEKAKLKEECSKLKKEKENNSSVSSQKIIESIKEKEIEIEELKKDNQTQIDLLNNKIELMKSQEGKFKKQIFELKNKLELKGEKIDDIVEDKIENQIFTFTSQSTQNTPSSSNSNSIQLKKLKNDIKNANSMKNTLQNKINFLSKEVEYPLDLPEENNIKRQRINSLYIPQSDFAFNDQDNNLIDAPEEIVRRKRNN